MANFSILRIEHRGEYNPLSMSALLPVAAMFINGLGRNEQSL
jgi:hypothetical protein